MIEELQSPKLCKNCGKSAYSFRMGWEDNEGNIHWHLQRNYNQCKECRAKMYVRITKIKKDRKDKQKGTEVSDG